jgi:hypothetical protein
LSAMRTRNEASERQNEKNFIAKTPKPGQAADCSVKSYFTS